MPDSPGAPERLERSEAATRHRSAPPARLGWIGQMVPERKIPYIKAVTDVLRHIGKWIVC